ncbi:hypothetical protein CcaCcLH18_13370 [Colletotrichum camelliae]|nr:hypothetical protein CcaCcLH18_13370 [Colletotrichum camelliae]
MVYHRPMTVAQIVIGRSCILVTLVGADHGQRAAEYGEVIENTTSVKLLTVPEPLSILVGPQVIRDEGVAVVALHLGAGKATGVIAQLNGLPGPYNPKAIILSP